MAFPTMAQIPAVRLCLASLGWAVLVWVSPLRWRLPQILPWVLLAVVVLAVACLWWRRTAVAYWLATLGLGAAFATGWQTRLPPRTEAWVQPFPAYVVGRVVEVLRYPSPKLRCVVEGRIDAQPLPPLRGRIVLTVFDAEGVEPWAHAGSRIRATVSLRPPRPALLPTDFPEWDYCAGLGAQWVATTSAHAVAWVEEKPSVWEELESRLARWREQLRSWIAELYRPEVRGFALALLLGDRSELSPQQKREFALTGTSHIIAISGLHVGVVAGALLVLAGFLPWRWVQWLLFTLALSLFVVLTGAQPSALRAAFMASLGWGMYLLQRQPHPLNIVAATAFMLLVAAPELAFSRSFQLSILATAGIVLLFEPFAEWLRQLVPHLPQALRQLLALTAAATCASAPIAAAAFGTFSLLTLPLNLLAVPLSSCAVIAGVIGMCLYPLVPLLGMLYSKAAEACLMVVQESTRLAAQLPIAAVEGPESLLVAVGSSLLLLWLLRARRWSQVLARVCIAGSAMVLATGAFGDSRQPRPALLPREHLVVAFLPDRGTTLVVLVDRFPQRKPRPDPALEQYLSSLAGPLRIAYTGYTSKLLALRCQRRRRETIALMPAPAELLQYIEARFRLRQPLIALSHPLP